jgi:hypothetical protein
MGFTKNDKPNELTKTDKGRKDDSGKPRWSLLPWKQVEDIVKVMTFGSKKYADFNFAIRC